MKNIETLIKNKNHIGETNITGYGSLMTVIYYTNCKNIIVRFDKSGYEKNTNYRQFKLGSVKSPYCRSVHGVGYLGEGNYTSRINGEKSPQYVAWNNMLQRCYSVKFQATRPTYIGCSVCEEWLNYQNFAKWYDENYYEIESKSQRGMNLDKDILKKNNKIYCPEYCIYVPDSINLLFIKKNANRGNLPIGVNKEGKKYIAQCSVSDGGISKQEQIGTFFTIEEAFNAYKYFKEEYIKQVANEYRDIIPNKLFEALYKYKVEITD